MGAQQSNYNEDAESQEYFDLLNQKVTYEIKSKLTQKNGNKTIKNWKSTIIKYLTKQNDIGITWCDTLKKLIEKTNFTSEKKFIDLFIWQKFEIKTKPKCLSQKGHYSFGGERTNSIDNINSDIRKSRYTSIADVSQNEYKIKKEQVSDYIKIFKSHLESNDHPISICIQLFYEVFCKEIQFHLTEIKDYNDYEQKIERAKLVAEGITQQLVFFLFKLQKCFGLMYSSVLSYKYFESQKEEFTNMFTTEFFKNEELYFLIMELFAISNDKEITSLNKHIEELNTLNIKTNDFAINVKFCLDKTTEKFQMNYIKEHNIKLSDNNINYLKSFNSDPNYIPYSSMFQSLKNIRNFQTPFEKISLLHSFGDEVIKNVMNIWKPLEKYIPNSLLSIDGDELIQIFSYIIIKTKMHDLLAHLFFIKMFTTQDTKSSMIGYYYTVIEASIITIQDTTKENILNKRDKFNVPFEERESKGKVINDKQVSTSSNDES